MIYQWIKNKRPISIIIKKRMNKNILIVCGTTLETYYLNRVAAIIVESIDGKKTINDIKNILLNRFDVDEKEIEYDLINIIRDLQWKKLIKLED